MSDRNIKTLAKVVVDASSDRVLGIHMVGEHASEILQVRLTNTLDHPAPPPPRPQEGARAVEGKTGAGGREREGG